MQFVVKAQVSAYPRTLAVNALKGLSSSCQSWRSSVRSTQVATGKFPSNFIAASSWGRVSPATLGLTLRTLSPNSIPAHRKSWEGADASSIPYPDRKTSQRCVKTFHSLILQLTPTSMLGRSSFGPRSTWGTEVESAAGVAGYLWVRSWFVIKAIPRASETSQVLKSRSGTEN